MSGLEAEIKDVMFAKQGHRGAGFKFATGFEFERFGRVCDEIAGARARAFVMHLGIAHMSLKHRREVWSNAVAAAQAAQVASTAKKSKPHSKGGVTAVSPPPAPRTVETTTPSLNDDILRIICAFVAPKVTFTRFLHVMERSFAVKCVEERVYVPGAYHDQRVMGFFPSLGPAETGYFFEPYPCPGPSTFDYEPGIVTVLFQREPDRFNRPPADETLYWKISVDFRQVQYEPRLDPRIPDAAVSFETNLATQAGRLGLTPADVDRLTSIRFGAVFEYSCSRLTFQGQNEDGCFGGICRVETPWVPNRALQAWAGISVGDHVRLKDAFKRYIRAKGATGVVREIRWLSTPTYYVALDAGALTQLVEHYHGQTKGAKEMTVGQLAGDVACRRCHLELV